MILEGILSTINEDQSIHLSPMGPRVPGPDFKTFLLRPYKTSTTFRNLQRTRQGVFHVTDDVELIASSAIGAPHPIPSTRKAKSINGHILLDACQWFSFTVESLDASTEPARLACRVLDHATIRDFFGFCRAKHAVIEAAILATRITLLPPSAILADFDKLRMIVEKTGGDAEHRAFARLEQYVHQTLSPDSAKQPTETPS